MSSSNSNSNTRPVRRRNPMACTDCREHKLKCEPTGAENSPCKRCVRHNKAHTCKYRPVEASSSHPDYQDNHSIALTDPYSGSQVPPANQLLLANENGPQLYSPYSHSPAPFDHYPGHQYQQQQTTHHQHYSNPQPGYPSMAPAPYPTQPNSNYFHPPNPPNPSVPPFYHTPGPYDQNQHYNSPNNNNYGNYQTDNYRSFRQ